MIGDLITQLDARDLVAGDEVACTRGRSTHYSIAGCYKDSTAVADGSHSCRISSDVVAHDHDSRALDFDSRVVPGDDISCRRFIASNDCLRCFDPHPAIICRRSNTVWLETDKIALNHIAGSCAA